MKQKQLRNKRWTKTHKENESRDQARGEVPVLGGGPEGDFLDVTHHGVPLSDLFGDISPVQSNTSSPKQTSSSNSSSSTADAASGAAGGESNKPSKKSKDTSSSSSTADAASGTAGGDGVVEDQEVEYFSDADTIVAETVLDETRSNARVLFDSQIKEIVGEDFGKRPATQHRRYNLFTLRKNGSYKMTLSKGTMKDVKGKMKDEVIDAQKFSHVGDVDLFKSNTVILQLWEKNLPKASVKGTASNTATVSPGIELGGGGMTNLD